MSRTGRIFGMAATYIGTVVGAGFASGQEILTFFARFGPCGFGGLALASLLLALTAERALALGAGTGQGNTYYQSLLAMFGDRLAPYIDTAILLFLCVLVGVMLAGAGALALALDCPAWLGILITACLGLLVLAADIPGIVTVNKLVVPYLIPIAAAVALGSLGGNHLSSPPANRSGWFPAALLYASYNTVLSFPVLIALGAAERDYRVRRLASIFGTGGLFLMGGLILTALLGCSATAMTAEAPMAAMAIGMGKTIGLAYSLLLWAGMFTSLLANAYGAAIRFRQIFGGPLIVWAGATMALGIILSRFGFVRLVRTAYPAFGLFSLLILVRLLWRRWLTS